MKSPYLEEFKEKHIRKPYPQNTILRLKIVTNNVFEIDMNEK
jgi:hypothetical protein